LFVKRIQWLRLCTQAELFLLQEAMQLKGNNAISFEFGFNDLCY